MTHKSDDDDPATPGGHAAERLREFIDQRFPGGMPLPEGAEGDREREPAADANDLAAETEDRALTDQQREESQ